MTNTRFHVPTREELIEIIQRFAETSTAYSDPHYITIPSASSVYNQYKLVMRKRKRREKWKKRK